MSIDSSVLDWIVKKALTDETVDSESIIQTMKKNGLTSEHLLNYIDNDSHWPLFKSDPSFNVSPQDEKYIIHFGKHAGKKTNLAIREQARNAVYTRFYKAHRRYSEWDI